MFYFENVFCNTVSNIDTTWMKEVISNLVNCGNELPCMRSLIAIRYCINCTWNLMNLHNRLAKKHFCEITCTFKFRNAFQRVVISSRRLGPSNLSWFIDAGIHNITIFFQLQALFRNGPTKHPIIRTKIN